MTDDPTFDGILEARLRALAASASRPFDAGEIARAAVAATRPQGTAPAHGRWGLVLLGVALLLALATGGVFLAGSLLLRQSAVPPPVPATLAIAAEEGLELAEADGSSPRVVDGRGPFFTPRWSPDGTMLAASAILPQDMNALLVFDATGDLMGSATNVAGFAWSPDSRRLVVVDAADPMLSIVAVGKEEPGSPEVPLPIGTLAVLGADWLSDGRIVAALSLEGEAGDEHGLWLLDPDTGSATRMGGDAGRNAVHPVVSPDGTRIAVSVPCPTEPGCEPLVRIVDAGSGQRRSEIENARSAGALAWAPDGNGIAVSFTRDDRRVVTAWWDFARDVQLLDPWPEGNTLVEQVLPGGAGLLVTHPDPISGRGELWRLPLDSSAPVRLASGVYGGALQPEVPAGLQRTPAAPGTAWVPPLLEGPVPAAVRDRDVVPFCGVDGGYPGDPARACLARALEAGTVVELATDQETADGWRLAAILRTTPRGGGVIIHLTDTPRDAALWESQACDSILVRADGVEIGACGTLEPIE